MITVTTEQELIDAIAASEPEIDVGNDIALSTPLTINYELKLTSNGSVLSWTGTTNGTMFSIISGAAFTVGDIILDGLGAYATLVSVIASTFIMNDLAILRNVRSNSSNNAVKVGRITDVGLGGTFLMNGGLITGIMLDAAVSCIGGTITMSGDAGISQNQAYGIAIVNGTINMTGNSRITENVAARTGAGILATEASIINMGLSEDDAPQISQNESTTSYSGGVYLSSGSVLNMNYRASITGNKAVSLAGGVGLSASTLNMDGDAIIGGNSAETGGGGGVFAASASEVNMAGNTAINGNSITDGTGLGGGIYLQGSGTSLTMRELASIYGNEADNGAGIYLNTGTNLNMSADATYSPYIYRNTAGSGGGGIYIADGATAAISGESKINSNDAGVIGAGICNMGLLNIAQGIQIEDGLYYNSQQKVPVITQALTESSLIQLEASDYMSPDNIPVVVAEKGDSYSELTETECAAFNLPSPFPVGTPVYLNMTLNQVLAGMMITINNATLKLTQIV